MKWFFAFGAVEMLALYVKTELKGNALLCDAAMVIAVCYVTAYAINYITKRRLTKY